MASGDHLILFDGVCGLCDRFVQFVLRRDARGAFDFASLQSATGRSTLERFGRNADALDTVYVLTSYRTEGSTLLSKADAALFVAKTLGGPWRAAAWLAILPKGLRDWGYDVVARHRYRVFGRYDSCMLPPPEVRKRFIDV